jgi:hypothetical protein
MILDSGVKAHLKVRGLADEFTLHLSQAEPESPGALMFSS